MNDFTCDTNYLQPTGFKVTVSKKNYPYLSFFAQSIQHPSLEINSVNIGYKRMAGVPFIGDAAEFGSVTMDILLDENMKVYDEVYNWMQRMLETEHRLNTGVLYGNGDQKLADYNDIRVSILSSANNGTKEFQYVNAFPVTLGDIAFSATNEETFITCPMTFQFDYFEFV